MIVGDYSVAPIKAHAELNFLSSILWWEPDLYLPLQAQIGTLWFRRRKTYVLFFVVQANVAQLVEQLICNQLVGGSSPFIGSVNWFRGDTQAANGGRL